MHEQRDVIAEHYRLAEELYGSELCGRQMRKFGIKYSRLHPQAHEVRGAFIAVSQASQLGAVLDRWYSEDLPGVHPQVDEAEGCEIGA